jgi:hypothetical protein
MIRIARLALVDRPGERNRLEWQVAPGVRVEVRRDDVDGKNWHLLSTHPLVPAPSPAQPSPERPSRRPPSQRSRAAAAARDVIDQAGDSRLDDRLDDIGCAS